MVLTEYDKEYQSMLDCKDGFDEGLEKAARNFVPIITSANPELTAEQAFQKALEIAKSNQDK